MPRSSGRLNLAGALNRNMPPNHLSPLTSEPGSKHASVCRLERELKIMKEENDRVKAQLEDTRSALKQITNEASLEKFDERRVNMLKLQIIQLQRQVLLMSEAIGSRSTTLMEVENALTWLSEKFRHYIGLDVRGPEVNVSRSDIMSMVETCESARMKLFKSLENCTKENLAQPQMFMNSFVKPGQDEEVSMLDCCMGRTDYLNLRHVAQLESRLSTTYKELIKVSEYLTSRTKSSHGLSSDHMSGAVREREGTVVLRACAMTRDCAADLLTLSLLFPAAPWPPLKKASISEVTYDTLAPSLPPLPRSKAVEVQRCVTAALQTYNHRCHMMSQEACALREEVRFHQDVYRLQLDYIQQVSDAFRQGYQEFEDSTSEVLVQPMKRLLEAFAMLKSNTSQEGLREFLTILKQHEQQWTDIVEKLDTADPQHHSGSAALSVFGQEFLSSLNRLVVERQEQRDAAGSQKEELKTAQKQLEEELRSLIRDGEEQQKIAREMKEKDIGNNSETDKVDSENCSHTHTTLSSHGRGPCLDDGGASQHRRGRNKGRKLHNIDRKPWVDVEYGSDSEDGMKKNRNSSGLRPWLDSPVEQGTMENETNTGLRPWLDDPYLTEEGQIRSLPVKKKKPIKDPGSAGGVSSVDDMYHSQSVSTDRSSHDNDCTNLESGRHSAGGEGSARFPDSESDSQLKLTRNSHSGGEGRSLQTDSAQKLPPPSGAGKKQVKGRRRNYEPKLYVANRTLSLRRSGSLTKLSEPSLEEKMNRLSLFDQQKMDSARTNSRQSTK